MKAGKLRHTLIFEVKTETVDSFGTAIETWAEDFSVKGSFEPYGTSEFPSNQKRYEETTARFRIRYRYGINAATHRITFLADPDASPIGFRTFNIFPPLMVDGKRFEMLIEAVEVV